MSIEEARARVKARIWQAIAQSDLQLKQFPREEVEALVDLTTDAALLEVDEELAKVVSLEAKAKSEAPEEGSEEQILWEGRPFLSISTRYVITNERVRIFEGLFGKDREDIELVRIQDIDQSQSLGERLFKLGDLLIHSHDPNVPTLELRNVREPEEVHEILRRAVLKAREKYGLRYREEM